MLEVLKFILSCTAKFIAMLFTIDVGFTSLGVVMCVIFIFLPIVLAIVNFLKGGLLEELNERYDESRPTEIWRTNDHFSLRDSPEKGHIFHVSHIRTKKRRYK